AEPYVIVKKTARGDSRFEGFAVDLLDAVCARISCRYNIYLSEEGIGNRRDRGMIGEVARGAADLALGPIAITPMRRQAVDFSTPWLDVPLSVLIRRDTDITSLEELLDQETIRYGVSINGIAMMKFFGTREEPYSRMVAKMAANPNVYVSGVEAGLSKVLSENYSFILDQPMATYLANKRCELTAFGKFLDNDQGYGFAMTKGDQLIPAINAAVADMKQDGTIKTLYKKWWRGGNCMPKECEVVSGGTSLPFLYTWDEDEGARELGREQRGEGESEEERRELKTTKQVLSELCAATEGNIVPVDIDPDTRTWDEYATLDTKRKQGTSKLQTSSRMQSIDVEDNLVNKGLLL
ncbi:hypothetical protein LSAT2_019808, partial [Lamellibrachia satsuma]